MNPKQNIIFFDGHCGLCDRFITEIFSRDKKHRFYFAPLQGPTARQKLQNVLKTDSVVYLKDEKIYLKSQAVLEIFKDLGGYHSFFQIFQFIPLKLRDALYDLIARKRYSWFGQSETCRLPSEEEKIYFLP